MTLGGLEYKFDKLGSTFTEVHYKKIDDPSDDQQLDK
eukprot:CAMPEP_0197850158 /NCGR_PEP_ID=MMETSP1438-20131217/14426_1 /TAXON_ID=1461541 /ORGANISM="Pterosperma sp., Strain CCMP1384" /LENGTH=36 /DNA_ID= /DNA_START= /DNA_END= /DNA_ORIENTATION=